ncbi:MAG: ribonucleotide reductase N-terminal alpha domain-containing protein, partial [bacterium]
MKNNINNLFVTKRNGEKEKFDFSKILKWEKWASSNIEDVNIKEITLSVLNNIEDNISTQDIQLKIIQECLKKRKFNYYLLAGRLYAVYMRKKIYNEEKDNVPSLYKLHTFLQEKGLLRKLNYTEEEYDYIDKNIIDHNRDFNYTYIQVYQMLHKYSLSDRVNKILYETPQFVFIRMAMALSENEGDTKLESVKKFYDYFSLNKINAPTPNYINLGTNHNGFISCCLYTAGDTAKSLSIGDHIAYVMTFMSAGIGSFINSRSINDPVKNGFIKHKGKLPYFKSLASAVNANLQGGRGGASTSF